MQWWTRPRLDASQTRPMYVWYLIVYRCWYEMSPKSIYLFQCWNFTIGMSSHWVQNWKYYSIYVFDSCSLCVTPAVFNVFNLTKLLMRQSWCEQRKMSILIVMIATNNKVLYNVAELVWAKKNVHLIVMIAMNNKVLYNVAELVWAKKNVHFNCYDCNEQ